MRRTFTIYTLLGLLGMLLLPTNVYGIFGTPENLQVLVSGSEVTFSWSGTGDADIHAVMLWDKNTQQNTKAYTSWLMLRNFRWGTILMLFFMILKKING